jgi:hypothetical protein
MGWLWAQSRLPLGSVRRRTPPRYLFPMISTFNTYPELLTDSGRLAETVWQHAETLGQAIAATIALDSTAVILRATGHGERIVGLAPGGLA